jgi:hypothetical protein
MELIMSNQFGMTRNCRGWPIEFSVNPLLTDIALWNDADICESRPIFGDMALPVRIEAICSGLAMRGVAAVLFLPTALWIPTDEIEKASETVRKGERKAI